MKLIFLIYFICSCCLVFIAFIIFAILALTFFSEPTTDMGSTTPGRMKPFFGSKDLRVPVGRALQICEEEGLYLPLPQSRQEMYDIVALIKSNVNDSACNFVPFGYRADPRIRYLSIDGSKQWPALDFNQSSALPSLDRDCVKLTNNRVVSEIKPCRDVKTKCSLGLEMTSEICVDHRYSCVRIRWSKTEQNIVGHINMHLDEDVSNYGIAIVDPDHIPVGVTKSKVETSPCLTLGARYELQFRSIYDDSIMPFDFTDLDIPDPEYNCVGVAVKKDYNITTAACTTEACIVCV